MVRGAWCVVSGEWTMTEKAGVAKGICPPQPSALMNVTPCDSPRYENNNHPRPAAGQLIGMLVCVYPPPSTTASVAFFKAEILVLPPQDGSVLL